MEGPAPMYAFWRIFVGFGFSFVGFGFSFVGVGFGFSVGFGFGFVGFGFGFSVGFSGFSFFHFIKAEPRCYRGKWGGERFQEPRSHHHQPAAVSVSVSVSAAPFV